MVLVFHAGWGEEKTASRQPIVEPPQGDARETGQGGCICDQGPPGYDPPTWCSSQVSRKSRRPHLSDDRKMKKKSSAAAQLVRIYAATLGRDGAVVKEAEIDETEAVAMRSRGEDVVVCGSDHVANLRQAKSIEQQAHGPDVVNCPPHPTAGARALPHFHPRSRHVGGHCFYETKRLKAKRRQK